MGITNTIASSPKHEPLTEPDKNQQPPPTNSKHEYEHEDGRPPRPRLPRPRPGIGGRRADPIPVGDTGGQEAPTDHPVQHGLVRRARTRNIRPRAWSTQKATL